MGRYFSFQYKKNKTHFTFGGGWDEYEGKHYDIVTWAPVWLSKKLSIYVNVPAYKRDFNLYAKILQDFG